MRPITIHSQFYLRMPLDVFFRRNMPRSICLILVSIIACLPCNKAWAEASYSQVEKEALISLMAQIDPKETEILPDRTENPDRPWENTLFGEMLEFSNDGSTQRVTGLALGVDESRSTLNFPKLDNLKSVVIGSHAGLREIKGLEELHSLEELTIWTAGLAKLDSNNLPLKTLKKLSLYGFPNLSSMELSQAAALETIKMEHIGNLEELSIQQCPQLEKLEIVKSGLREITINDNLKIYDIALVSNKELRTVNIKSCPSLREFYVMHTDFKEQYYTPLETLNLSFLPNLSRMQLTTTTLTTLDISKVPSLKRLLIADNPQLSAILLGKNNQLSEVLR